MYYQAIPTVRYNTITDIFATSAYGIRAAYCDSTLRIYNNSITLTNGGYGIYIYYSDASSNYPGMTYNNMISVSGGSTAYAMYLYYSTYQDIYYNSTLVTTSSTSGKAFYGYSSSSTTYVGNKLFDNIFSNTGGGYASYVSYSTYVDSSDYNDFYAPSSTNIIYSGSDYTTLSAYQSASGQDANSLNVNPVFKSNTDLHTKAASLNGKATPVTSITVDFDNQSRNSSTPDIGADEFTPPAVDAGISALVSPVSACAGTADLKVKLKNYGIDAIDSVRITYLLNGTTQTDTFYYLNPLTSGKDTVITVGNISLNGTSQNVKIYTSLPNNSSDGSATNDTLKAVLQSAMNGSYSIGSSGDYTSFTSAVNDLKTRGICGAVTFNVADSTYNEQISLTEITGASATNTITFRSASGDSTKVILSLASSTTSGNNYLLELKGADYFVFKEITFERTDSNTYGTVLAINSGATNNRFDGCRFYGVFLKTVSSNRALVYSSSGSNDDFNTFSHNIFSRSDYGIYYYGTSTSSLENGSLFEYNQLDSIYDYVLYLYYQNAPVIRYNTISDIPGANTPFGIRTSYCDSTLRIYNNKITLSEGGYGIYVYYSDASSSDSGMIFNNMVSLGGTGTAYGIYLYNCNYQEILYNSVLVHGNSGSDGKPMYAYASSATSYKGNSIYNNIFANTGSGVAIEASTSATSGYFNSDYNNFFAKSGTLGVWGSASAASLADWQTASGMDTNSVFGNPKFQAQDNLHASSAIPNNKALAVNKVTADFDGDSRSSTAPDMGADEFSPGANDLTLASFTNPASGSCGDSMTPVSVIISNVGSNDQSSFSITAKVTQGSTTQTFTKTYSGTLKSGSSDELVITNALNTYKGGTFDIKAYSSLSSDADRTDDTVSASFSFNAIPDAPSVKGDSICGLGKATVSVSPDSGYAVRWYNSASGGKPIASTDTVSLSMSGPDTFYVEQLQSSNYSAGPPTNSIGSGANYNSFTDGLVFDALSDFTLDTVFVYPKGSGDVVVNVYYSNGTLLSSKTVSITTTTKTAIPLGFKIPQGSGYTINAKGTTTGGLYRNSAGAVYPYKAGSLVSINEAINKLSGYYYFFYDWKISAGGCASPRVPVVVVFNEPPKEVNFIKGQTFDGSYNAGTAADPDKVCALNTISYELNPPKGYTNSDFMSKWTVTYLNFTTMNGTAALDTTSSPPSAAGNGKLSFTPRRAYHDSTFVLLITVKDLVKGCDTTVMRYVKVLAKPTAKFGSENACEGESITFHDSSDVGFSAAYYSYDFGDGSTSTDRSPVHTYAAAGTYTVTLSVTNGSGCKDTFSRPVTVYPKPVAGFTPATACAGVGVQFNDTSGSAGDSILFYQWSFGDSAVSSVKNPLHTFNKAGTYYVSLKVTSIHGCSDSIRKAVKVYSLPTAAFTAKAVCEGESTSFNLTTSSGSAAYHWYFGDNTDTSGIHPLHKYDSAGTYIVKLIVTNGNGCKDSVISTVVVNARPKASFSTADVCSGNAAVFVNDTLPNNSSTTYQWTFGDGMTSSDKSPAHIYATAGTYTVTLVATGAGSCTDTASQQITIHPLPKAAFSAANVCEGDSVLFMNNSSISSGNIVSSSWNFGDSSSSSLNSPAHLYAKTGSYTVWLKVQSDNGCIDSVSKTITVFAKPVISFTKSVSGRKVTLTTSDNTLSKYYWSFGDNSTDSSGATVTHTYAKDSIYTIELTVYNTNGCSSSRTDTVKVSGVGIEEPGLAEDLKLRIYPNPYKETVNIAYDLKAQSQVQIDIYSLDGKARTSVYKGSQTAGEHTYILKADQYNMPAGVYVVRIIVNGNVLNKQIIRLK